MLELRRWNRTALRGTARLKFPVEFVVAEVSNVPPPSKKSTITPAIPELDPSRTTRPVTVEVPTATVTVASRNFVGSSTLVTLTVAVVANPGAVYCADVAPVGTIVPCVADQVTLGSVAPVTVTEKRTVPFRPTVTVVGEIVTVIPPPPPGEPPPPQLISGNKAAKSRAPIDQRTQDFTISTTLLPGRRFVELLEN